MAPVGKKHRAARTSDNTAQADWRAKYISNGGESTASTTASLAEVSSNWSDTDTTASTCAETPKQALTGTPTAAIDDDKKEDSENQRMVYGVGAALVHMAAMASTQGPERLTCFHSKFLPSLSVQAYFNRLRGCMRCSSECYVLALIYVDRLLKRCPQMVFSPLSSHRLMITTMTLAAKFHDDAFFSNAFYAKVGGISTKELNALERRLLQLLDFRLNVSAQEYTLYAAMVRKAASGLPVQE